MNKNKEAFCHKLLNILTLANLSVENEKMDITAKGQISSLINLAALLVKYEDVLLGKKPKLFRQKINLKEILEITLIIYKKKISKNNINFIIPDEDFFIEGSQNSIKDGLELLISKLLDSANRMEFQFDRHKNTLTISYKGKLKTIMGKKELNQSFNEEAFKSDDMALPLALAILGINKVKFDLKKNNIIITFPV